MQTRIWLIRFSPTHKVKLSSGDTRITSAFHSWVSLTLTCQPSLSRKTLHLKSYSRNRRRFWLQVFPCELLLANLGNLPCECDFDDLKLKALWGPAVLMGFQGEQTVGVTTANGSLCTLHSSFAALPAFLQRTERILRSVCEG
jgi:hypothetical protein